MLYALKNGCPVGPQDTPRGNDCGADCPLCGEPVTARKGDVRVWHFGHQSDSDCPGPSKESQAHFRCKHLLATRLGGEVEVQYPGLRYVADVRAGDTFIEVINTNPLEGEKREAVRRLPARYKVMTVLLKPMFALNPRFFLDCSDSEVFEWLDRHLQLVESLAAEEARLAEEEAARLAEEEAARLAEEARLAALARLNKAVADRAAKEEAARKAEEEAARLAEEEAARKEAADKIRHRQQVEEQERRLDESRRLAEEERLAAWSQLSEEEQQKALQRLQADYDDDQHSIAVAAQRGREKYAPTPDEFRRTMKLVELLQDHTDEPLDRWTRILAALPEDLSRFVRWQIEGRGVDYRGGASLRLLGMFDPAAVAAAKAAHRRS